MYCIMYLDYCIVLLVYLDYCEYHTDVLYYVFRLLYCITCLFRLL